MEWASRCPLGPGSKVEVRHVTEMGGFGEAADHPVLKQQELWCAGMRKTGTTR
jgi:hypothetical protein